MPRYTKPGYPDPRPLYLEGCERCTFLDGRGRDADVIEAFRQEGAEATSRTLNGLRYTLRRLCSTGRLRRYWREGPGLVRNTEPGTWAYALNGC